MKPDPDAAGRSATTSTALQTVVETRGVLGSLRCSAMTPRLARKISMAMLTAAVVIIATPLGGKPASAADQADSDVYQIVKATADRVWRLNKRTGEITVCALDGDNLICTTSTDAITPPSKTFEERQAEKRQAEEEAAKRREDEKAKDLAFLDRALNAIKSLIQAAIERDAAGEKSAD